MKKMLLTALFSFSLLSFQQGSCENIVIHENGYWIGADAAKGHRFDLQLARGLARFFRQENARTVVDFGCGMGDYVKALRASGIDCEGYDGNPDTFQMSGGVAGVKDLSKPFDLQKKFDWVLSLEVGEHLPKVYETIFIENLHRHNAKGIVLSWALEGQGGDGHFNEQNNDYVKKVMAQYGYVNDQEAENELRRQSTLPWFKNTIMVFRKTV